MFVPLPSLTDKKGERMNGVMNYRRGGDLQTMIMRPRDCLFRRFSLVVQKNVTTFARQFEKRV